MPYFLSARTVALSLAMTSLTGCGALTAQNPSGRLSPVNAVSDDPESRLMLKGADKTHRYHRTAHA